MDASRFLNDYALHPRYRSPRGNRLNALSWQTEAPLRMLLNNLDAEVAEDPGQLVVYGGTGKAARDPESLEQIIRHLLVLKENESLLIQSGRVAGVVRSHPAAPRVYIANSNLVPAWATWEHFHELEARGLMMYGQMTAGSWMYIGTQGILQGTYETFMAAARKHFGSDLRGRLVVSAGLGGMGGAQPLAATMAGAVFLGMDVDEARIRRRLETRYLDRMTSDYSQAMIWVREALEKNEPLSVGLVANAADALGRLVAENVVPDLLTDQTSAHDPLHGYVPSGLSLVQAAQLRTGDPGEYRRRSLETMARHVGHMVSLMDRGAHTFDYGNNLREFARQGGQMRAFAYPGFVPAYIRPLFCEGKGPFRFIALSGEPEDIRVCDQALLEAFPRNPGLHAWIEQAQQKVAFQGLPARICWLGLGEREKAGLIFNRLVREGRLKAPVVIGRDHLDCGSVASPNRETEGMKDGSDAVSDWPLLNLMANTGGGATWVSFHHGGGVGIGYSQHAGQGILADGSPQAEECLRRVLYNDPAMGIFRHASAGYEEARRFGENEHVQF